MAFSRWKALLILVGVAVGGAATAQAQDWQETAKEPGIHLLMRHAIAPGTGDPSNFALDDCATQRNLSEEGRRQARRTGKLLREAGVSIDIVLTSQWCRTRETAELLDLADAQDAPFLNSFFEDRSSRGEQTKAAIEELKSLTANGKRAALVTHQVNITALTDIFPSSGEIILIRLNAEGEVIVAGRIAAAN